MLAFPLFQAIDYQPVKVRASDAFKPGSRSHPAGEFHRPVGDRNDDQRRADIAGGGFFPAQLLTALTAEGEPTKVSVEQIMVRETTADSAPTVPIPWRICSVALRRLGLTTCPSLTLKISLSG